MPENKDVIDVQLARDSCPLCGALNQCQSEIAQECRAEHCWCYAQSFPAELLAQLPEGERGQRCICQGCLETFLAVSSKP